MQWLLEALALSSGGVWTRHRAEGMRTNRIAASRVLSRDDGDGTGKTRRVR